MGETRVDLQHLLEDLRDAYTGALEETILTEAIANALDSRATRIQLVTNAAEASLTIVDDGRGMQRRELARFHDVAASTKPRGEGIGFAGVGIKLGLLVSREVITETRRGATHVATRWHLASRHRAPWKWIPPPGLTTTPGTAVKLILSNQLSPLLDTGYLDASVRLHFEPLIDPACDELLRRHYANGVIFEVDGRVLRFERPMGQTRVLVSVRLGRRRTPSATGVVERDAELAPGRNGIAVSTLGKVIKRGWDWLGLAPAGHAQISGLVEAPELAACLTLSKNDFIRSGAQGASYLAYRKAIQEVVSRQLAMWGDRTDAETRPRMARLERDLERVLEDLEDDFPLLGSLVDRRAGGQKRLPLPGRGNDRVPAPLFAADTASMVEPLSDASSRPRIADRQDGLKQHDVAPPGNGQPHDHVAASGALDTVAGRRRPTRYGLRVQFESRPDDTEPARLVDSTIWINDAHPAYTRAASSRSLGYHTAIAVALALAPLAVDTRDEHAFVTQFLVRWGGAHTTKRTSRRRRKAAS